MSLFIDPKFRIEIVSPGEQAKRDRYEFEYQVMQTMENQMVTFVRKIVVDENYQFEYKYQHKYKDRYMVLKIGNQKTRVLHNFFVEIEDHVFPTMLVTRMMREIHHLIDYSYKNSNTYCLEKRVLVYKRLSKHFFKCLYIHEDQILADIANITLIK